MSARQNPAHNPGNDPDHDSDPGRGHASGHDPAPANARRRVRRPARWLAALALVATAGLTAAACSSSGSSGGSGTSSAPAAPSQVSTHSSTALGEVFADASGKTLYTADQEAGGMISCTGGCLQIWHPVAAASGATASGGSASADSFGSVQRPDTGHAQLTFGGRPVYTFAEDSAPGDTHGNGVHDAFDGKQFTWHALAVHPGAQPSSPTSPSSPPSSNGSGGGYGY